MTCAIIIGLNGSAIAIAKLLEKATWPSDEIKHRCIVRALAEKISASTAWQETSVTYGHQTIDSNRLLLDPRVIFGSGTFYAPKNFSRYPVNMPDLVADAVVESIRLDAALDLQRLKADETSFKGVVVEFMQRHECKFPAFMLEK